MKKLTKIWGIGLALVLAFSLIFSVAPVSAGTLSWGDEDLPDEFVDNFGENVIDLSISGDGSTIYATAGGTDNDTGYGIIYRSTNNGESWTSISITDGGYTITPEHIAVTPDDPNYIAVAADNSTVFISDDAGANWDDLGLANDDTGFDTRDLAISVEKSGKHFVAVIGEDTGDSDGEVWSYEIGAIGADWDEISADNGYQGAEMGGAVAFSPNFYSDQVLAAVTANFTNNDVSFQVYSYNQGKWNSGAFDNFPEDLQQDTPTDLDVLDAAAIAMAPDYLGSDEDMRVAFVALTVDDASDPDTETSGLFRLDDDDVTVLKDEKAFCSVAFDGSLLVAGRYDDIDIYRSTDALEDSPSVSGSTGSREPGGVNKVLVGIAGSIVVAGTSGDESAFAYSEDNGQTFSDISLIDTWLNTLSDVLVTPDSEEMYLVSCDGSGVDLSVWYYDSRWERIYTNQSAAADYMLRMAPEDSDVLYLADAGGTNIYFSSGGGLDKWHTRIYKESSGVTDLAVEGDGDTVYVLTTSGYVSKSTNRGFTWDSKVSSKLTGGSSMLVSMGEDLLLGGSTDGRVAYSTDGNTSWTKIANDGFDDTGSVQVTATGLDDGDFVIAGSNDGVYAWELGADDEWDDISPDAITANVTINGIGIWEGVLYVLGDDTANSVLARTLTPTDDDPTWSSMASADETFDATPTALRISSDGDITKIWAVDTTGTAADPMQLFSYKDTLALVGVSQSGPADGREIPFNSVSGDSEQVIFTWESPSDKVTEFDFVIATDSGFDEIVLDEGVPKSSGTWDEGDIISKIVGPGASGDFDIRFMPETTYYWRVRVDASGPIRSAWSETRSFTTGSLPEAVTPVVIEQAPAPVIQVPPSPEIILQPPEIVLPAPQPVPEIVIPAAPEPTPPIPSWAIYAIIIIGAVLVIALIVLIMRTRRPV